METTKPTSKVNKSVSLYLHIYGAVLSKPTLHLYFNLFTVWIQLKPASKYLSKFVFAYIHCATVQTSFTQIFDNVRSIYCTMYVYCIRIIFSIYN